MGPFVHLERAPIRPGLLLERVEASVGKPLSWDWRGWEEGQKWKGDGGIELGMACGAAASKELFHLS
jgi:hypothetical protein